MEKGTGGEADGREGARKITMVDKGKGWFTVKGSSALKRKGHRGVCAGSLRAQKGWSVCKVYQSWAELERSGRAHENAPSLAEENLGVCVCNVLTSVCSLHNEP